jgi:hypothetical protein
VLCAQTWPLVKQHMPPEQISGGLAPGAQPQQSMFVEQALTVGLQHWPVVLLSCRKQQAPGPASGDRCPGGVQVEQWPVPSQMFCWTL